MTTHNATAEHKAYNPPPLSRNGVIKELVAEPFSKKSTKFQGRHFFIPKFSQATAEDDIKWMGEDFVFATLNKSVRLIFMGIFVDAIDEETGVFDEKQYLEEIQEFTEGAQTLSDIEEQIEDLSARQSTLAADPDFDFVQGEEVSARTVEIMAEMKIITAKLKPLRAEKGKIKEKYAKRVALKKAKQDASAAKTQTVS